MERENRRVLVADEPLVGDLYGGKIDGMEVENCESVFLLDAELPERDFFDGKNEDIERVSCRNLSFLIGLLGSDLVELVIFDSIEELKGGGFLTFDSMEGAMFQFDRKKDALKRLQDYEIKVIARL